ncbi:MAG: hypothetical protein F6K53_39600 [Moorea sp. SIO4A1]|nr:hypothetical protein [Moorena sp. SIO4A1]
MANLITGQTHHYGLGKAARSWGGSAVLGVSPMSDCRSPSDCRGFPHERLHQDIFTIECSVGQLKLVGWAKTVWLCVSILDNRNLPTLL